MFISANFSGLIFLHTQGLSEVHLWPRVYGLTWIG